MTIKRACDCIGWKMSMDQIESAQIFHALRGVIYTGFEFVFCPWCGEKLTMIDTLAVKAIGSMAGSND